MYVARELMHYWGALGGESVVEKDIIAIFILKYCNLENLVVIHTNLHIALSALGFSVKICILCFLDSEIKVVV